jgi:quinol-cytochrome oxidoreductase complex cytochrome b subunit
VAKRGKRKRGKRQSAGEDRQPATEAEPTDVEPIPEPLPATQAAETQGATPEPPRPEPPRPRPQTEPAGLTAFWHHLHPRQVRGRTTTLGATLGLGLATGVSLAIATLSGILLMLHYVPSVERAHASVQDLMATVPLGAFLRNLHRWSAHASVLFCLLHMLRTLLWGSYRGAHARVWLVGVGLLLVTLATSFSGYLLPWDQDSFWTVTVGTSLASYVPAVGEGLRGLLLGGDDVGQPTLIRFHMLHVIGLPALGALLLALHLFRLRRAGGLARPSVAEGPSEKLTPAGRLISRELAVVLVVTVALVLLALGVDARLGPAPDLVRPDNPPKAPWFLVGVQEMVSYSATAGGFVFPTLLLALLAAGPWLDGRRDCDGAPLADRGARLTAAVATLAAGGAAVATVLWWGDPRLGQASWLNPAALAGLAALVVAGLAWRLGRSRSLAYRALVVGLVAALVVFTVVGWFWRGADWALTWHPGPGHPPPGGPP